MGGEPLLHPSFGKVVDHVRRHGMLCEAVSNGLLAPREIAHVRKLDSLLISLDGAREANDLYRRNAGGGGTYQQVVAAIEAVRAAGVPVRLNAVLTRESIADIEHLLDLADRYDLFVTFSPIGLSPQLSRGATPEFLPSAAETREVFVRLKKLRQMGRRVLTSPPALDYLAAYPAPYHKIILSHDEAGAGFSRDFCAFGRTLLYVDSNGDFYPCPALFDTDWYRPKSIHDGFNEAWEHLTTRACVACACPAVFDWNYVTSFGGLGHSLRTTWRQMRSRKT
jgi:MoaA/NifB/PqqE/SkfB family radical SAM enzyme